jgi:hypothetical protein
VGGDVSFASLIGFDPSLVWGKGKPGGRGRGRLGGLVERIGLTDSHEFFHLFSLHALLEFALFRSAKAETGKAVSICPNLSFSLQWDSVPVHLVRSSWISLYFSNVTV